MEGFYILSRNVLQRMRESPNPLLCSNKTFDNQYPWVILVGILIGGGGGRGATKIKQAGLSQ